MDDLFVTFIFENCEILTVKNPKLCEFECGLKLVYKIDSVDTSYICDSASIAFKYKDIVKSRTNLYDSHKSLDDILKRFEGKDITSIDVDYVSHRLKWNKKDVFSTDRQSITIQDNTIYFSHSKLNSKK